VDPLVSILVPAYNAEKWLEDAIHSALSQTWAKKEIIIVDDGSTDQTLAVARQFEGKDVRVGTQNSQGACVARNAALARSQGDFVQWLDGDDILAPDKIERQLQSIDRSPSTRTLLSSSWGRFYYRVHRSRFSPTSLWQSLPPVNWLTTKMVENTWMSIESWLISRELSEEIGPWDVRLVRDNDGEYFSRAVCASDGTLHVPESKSFVRRASFGSVSRDFSLSTRKAESIFLSKSLQIHQLRSLDDSAETRAVCLKYLQDWLIYFYPENEEILERSRDLALALGGELKEPELSWKYEAVRRVFGWRAAKKALFDIPKPGDVVRRGLDALLFRLES